MPFPEYDDIRSQRQTTSAITATGATTLVNAISTNTSILVDHLRVISLTATTGFVEFSFGDTTTVGHYFGAGNAVGELLSIDFSEPWRLETNSALIFLASIGAASTPTLRVTARIRELRRGNA